MKICELELLKSNSVVEVSPCFIRMTKGQSSRRPDTKWTSILPLVSSALFINCLQGGKTFLVLHLQIKQGGMNCITV